MSKRIILCRHANEPKQKRIEHIQSKVGLNDQGAIRASLMPELINKLIGNAPYELHTYTHVYKNEPTSRAYYTSQLLANQVLYPKSDDFEQLVENIKKSTANIIVVCWEHCLISKIINLLIGKHPDWDHYTQKIGKQLGKKYKVKETQKIALKDISTIKYCADVFLKQNKGVRDYYIKPKQDVSYSLIWDVDYDKKEYTVFPDYIIKRCKKHHKRFKVMKYV
jgi:hypothetical protein